jgi:hypothetical protein
LDNENQRKVRRDQKVVIFGIKARANKTLKTPSFVSFKTLVMDFFYFLVLYRANPNNKPNKEVVVTPSLVQWQNA